MKKRGLVTFVFDDGYTRVFATVVPLFRKLGLPAVFAIPLESEFLAHETGEAITTWQEWLSLRGSQFEIAAHSVTHTDLTKLSLKALDEELQRPRQVLDAHTVVYPGGAHNDAVLAQAKKWYGAARTVLHGIEHNPPRNPLKLVTYDFTRRSFSVWKANLLLCYAWLTNRWLIETYHLVDDGTSTLTHAVAYKDLERHLQFVRRLPIKASTIKDATKKI